VKTLKIWMAYRWYIQNAHTRLAVRTGPSTPYRARRYERVFHLLLDVSYHQASREGMSQRRDLRGSGGDRAKRRPVCSDVRRRAVTHVHQVHWHTSPLAHFGIAHGHIFASPEPLWQLCVRVR
jgi:hypothetical protein